MRKTAIILLLFLVIFSCLSFGSKVSSRTKKTDSDVIESVVSTDTLSSVKRLATSYKKGLIREKLGAYENALFAYSSCNARALQLLSYKKLSKKAAIQILPYAIASAYRKGILTQRTIEGSVMKLYKQLEIYQDANTTIDEVLTVISNLSTERDITIFPAQYYALYYARAYNRFGWAYALLNGSAWKRYIIYTPADTVTMVDKSISDINLAHSAFGIDYSRRGFSSWLAANNIYSVLKERLTNRSPEHLTYALCFNYYDIRTLNKIVEKQLLKKMKNTVEFYKENRTTRILNRGRKIFTYEEFMKPGTKELISTMGQFLEMMK